MLTITVFHRLQINEVRQSRLIQHVFLNTVVDHLDAANIVDDCCVRNVSPDFGMFRKQRFEAAFKLLS